MPLNCQQDMFNTVEYTTPVHNKIIQNQESIQSNVYGLNALWFVRYTCANTTST